MKSLFLA